MTKHEFRAQVKALHPDLNGGDQSKTGDLVQLLQTYRDNHTACACGCGRMLSKTQVNRKPPTRYFSKQCASRVINAARRKPKKLKR